MNFKAKWIKRETKGENRVCPVFKKEIVVKKEMQRATLYLSALGVYKAAINSRPVSQYVLAPGWTVYEERVQYQKYDITNLLEKENVLTVVLGKGWYSSPMPGWVESEDKIRRRNRENAIIAEIHITYMDGTDEEILTDESWLCSESPVRFSEIYDGEIYDATYEPEIWETVQIGETYEGKLVPQEGCAITEQEKVYPKEVIYTPSGETVIDFGQEITGYVEINLQAEQGQRIRFLHGEVLDKDGNFYNENYRSAKAEVVYICRDGYQTWHPQLTFFGFRYIKLEEFPKPVKLENFAAIAVHSDMKRTGFVQCGDEKINQLFSNIVWGQKGNFLDVPTDCPQRDERLGWTGDAQVFIKAASFNYDVEQFFVKWLHDLGLAQRKDGAVGQVIPDYLPDGEPSAAWGDAATICPWQIYLTYGNKNILEDQFESMKKWVDYITSVTTTPYLWTGGTHFGDWLGLDAEQGSYKGKTRDDFIASAFYARSTEILVKAGQVIGKNVAEYENLYQKIRAKFQEEYRECTTQTECVLKLYFCLTDDVKSTIKKLVEFIEKNENSIATGFVGTPYILHVLSEYGYNELAYTLFLRKKYPSWLYSVEKGATTVWEHWDGIMENGEFWSTDMNSYNHYAYGAVIDWVYEKAAGIQSVERAPGFEEVKIQPYPDQRLGWLDAMFHSRHGLIRSKWVYEKDTVRYEIDTPVKAHIIIADQEYHVEPGKYVYWNPCNK